MSKPIPEIISDEWEGMVKLNTDLETRVHELEVALWKVLADHQKYACVCGCDDVREVLDVD